MTNSSETHRVVIDYGKRFCEVEPGDLPVKNGDKVEFFNDTGMGIVLFFGNPALFGVPSVPLKPRDTFGPAPLGPLPAKKSFQYAVYCERTASFAVGGSNPRIIVVQ
jgi:hypothetical protein